MKNKLIENISSLFILQAANYVFPIIVFPYLVRMLGAEKYGLITYAFVIIQYFILLTDYGFNLTATREVSIHRKNNKVLSQIVSDVFNTKLVLLVFSFLVLSTMLLFVSKFRENYLVYLVSFIAVVGNFTLPLWFFQGIEELKLIAIVNVISKLIATVLIFLLVRDKSDYVLAAGLQSAPVVIAGIICIIILTLKYPLSYSKPSIQAILETLRKGWQVFISQISISFISNTPIFILGFFASLEAVGYYAIAYKICQVAINVHVPIANSIYPRVSNYFATSYDKGISFIKKVLINAGPIFVILSLSMFFGSDYLVKIVSGGYNDKISLLIKIMSIMPLSVFLDNLCGVQILLNTNRQKKYMISLLVGGLLCIILSFILAYYYKEIGIAIAFVSSELIILSMLFIFTTHIDKIA